MPVTEQLLRHYAESPNTHLIIREGYIYGHFVHTMDKTDSITDICEKHQFVHIVSERRMTQKSQRSYFRMYINRKKVRTADEFCAALIQHGFDVNLENEERTATWKLRNSVDVSSEFFDVRAEGKAAMDLEQSIKYLQSKRESPDDPENIGATIVIIPSNKSLADYKKYLKQYLPVSMKLTQDSLFHICNHKSVVCVSMLQMPK